MVVERSLALGREAQPGDAPRVTPRRRRRLGRGDEPRIGERLQVLREGRVADTKRVAQHREVDLIHRAEEAADAQPQRRVDDLAEATLSGHRALAAAWRR